MGLRDRAEWKTLLLILACYAAWIGVLSNPLDMAVWAQCLLLIPLITLHSSLQHECIHGHPFLDQRLNDALVAVPLGLFVPYRRFKAAHIKHHHGASLTDPYEDPESWYQTPERWQRLPTTVKILLRWNNRLVGRVLLGPLLSVIGFVGSELSTGRRTPATVRIWVLHGLAVIGLLAVIHIGTGLSAALYLLCAYLGYGLLSVRTFLEHQADDSMRARTVLIEDTGPLSWLFLNNNLHAVHHAYPNVAWYELPRLFRNNRERLLAMNQGYYFRSYAEIWRRFAFRAKEPVVYPLAGENRGQRGGVA
ncbi:fatty acid desaturase [Saccharospirillum salsuginis]|uniref:Fatty acid desaturase n=1 Tax=Saccharospirillum salsuginis TaxID=418750 RepID=A0A918NJ88_9GAMM|nr:fatty acid desaturase [Saccharospirillum salsuginis]GGX71756.1 fatty acid desaturase [Saccharospirillum salsuginis]